MDQPELAPHVLIFPFPAQGHVNSMLKLAELLCLSGIHVTYLVSASIHCRLLTHTNVQSRFNHYPGFCFQTLPYGLYEGTVHTHDGVFKLYESLKAIAKSFLRELMVSGRPITNARRPVTCVIADGVLSLAIEVGEEIGIPVIFFRTISACAFWAYFCIPELIEAGELPFNGDGDSGDGSLSGVRSFSSPLDFSHVVSLLSCEPPPVLLSSCFDHLSRSHLYLLP
ncbi:unnamed protein product [Ilex paraguariensis]|uniref:Glycosyltransferase N-terminal domain-containing protein n=1 Tax=Ilex paraguariensis TaxID=185542 RepID=A0ABC8RGE7_9AQUA